MASTAATLSSINSIMKEDWAEVEVSAQKAFYEEVPLLKRLEKKSQQTQGEYFVFPIQTNTNFGVGPRARTLSASVGTTPTAGSAGFAQGQVTPATYYGRLKIHATAMDAAMRNGTVWDLVGTNLKDTLAAVRRAVDIDLYGSGTGALTTTSTTGSGTSKTVGTTKYLQEGMPIAFADATGTNALAGTIASIDSETTLTLSGAVDTTTASTIYRQGITSGTAEAYNNSVKGLTLAISDTGTYAGINRATAGNGYWKAVAYNGAGGLTLDNYHEIMELQSKKAGGKATAIYTTYKTWRDYGNLIAPDRRWQGMTKTLDGGFTSLDFNGIPIIPTHECPAGYMFWAQEDTMKLLIEKDFGRRTEGDQYFFYDPDYDTYQMVLAVSLNLSVMNCAKNLVVTGLPS